jgi:hypothetical protein
MCSTEEGITISEFISKIPEESLPNKKSPIYFKPSLKVILLKDS